LEADQAAWQRYYELDTAFFTDALFAGQYPSTLMDWIGAMAPRVQPGDMKLINSRLDFLGVNYYRATLVAFDPQGGFLKCRATHRTLPMWGYTQIGWGVYPAGLTQVLVDLNQKYKVPKFYLTENGCAALDVPDRTGFVTDTERVEFLRLHLAAAWEAIQAGVDLRGYFVWSLMDNFEWAEGYTPRFGLVRVDYATQVRTPKQSFHWFQNVIARNGID
jgi:beta-glucosidase